MEIGGLQAEVASREATRQDHYNFYLAAVVDKKELELIRSAVVDDIVIDETNNIDKE